ncbi:radical SAM superfamily protein [Peptococcaceae bacterium CEB3]|nr:radical SAM superfamily protein [Peptococcaceae bacterium CEB3]
MDWGGTLNRETEEWIEKGWAVRLANFPTELYCDFPVATAGISVTGTACALNCAHCGGHYLRGMRPVDEVKNTGGKFDFRSALISGGCTTDGRVPFLPQQDFLRKLKEQVRLNFHVGLIDGDEMPVLKELADVVSFDFVADEETIREVYGLKRSPEDYFEAYRRLRGSVRVVPHLTLGLKGGEWQGEERALAKLEELGLDGLVFLVFIPTPGTRYAKRQPPTVEEVIAFLARARVRFPHIPLALGCMRPKGKYRRVLDEAAVALGLNRIVMPTPGARKLAGELGLTPVRTEECCAL